MENQAKVIKENYAKNFKAVEYHTELLDIYSNATGAMQLMLSILHDIIQSRRFEGTKLLEIGSGPTVHGIASASAYFSNIVQSDYVEDNLEHLKKWHAGDTTLDWSALLDIVVKLEGHEDNLVEGRKLLESRIRKSVKAVVHCDVLSESILTPDDLKTAETAPPYDLIISILCLEAAIPDFETYVSTLTKISKLLRKGGGIFMGEFENAGNWKIIDKEFHGLHLSRDDISKALEMAGFGNIVFKTCPPTKQDWYLKHDGFFCVFAEKL